MRSTASSSFVAIACALREAARFWQVTNAYCRGARQAGPLAVLCIALVSGGPDSALAEADGPDAWRVTGVSPGDTLNIRMGPGTKYAVIGRLPPDARGLEAITCVPLMSAAHFMGLSPAERADLPPRWCLVFDGAGRKGWVAGAYLAEDTLSDARETPPTPKAPLEQRALDLVTELYEAHLRAYAGTRPDPLRQRPEDFFFTEIAAKLAGGGLTADPLFGGQDADIRDLRVGLDPDRPMFRGMVSVVVRFRNFGREQTATVRLRADPQQEGAPRIFRIEHEGWSFP